MVAGLSMHRRGRRRGAAFVVVDLVLSAVLLHLVGEPRRCAARHLVDVDALTLPIAWYGALVALLLGGVGWWAIALALVPVAFVPELVIAAPGGAPTWRAIWWRSSRSWP